MKATLIVGLPGSGKTYLGKQIAAQTNATLIDDISIRGKNILEQSLSKQESVVITDCYLCLAGEREHATSWLVKHGYTLEWIFFENNVRAALANIKRRNDFRRVYGMVYGLTKHYTIPANVQIEKIWSSGGDANDQHGVG